VTSHQVQSQTRMGLKPLEIYVKNPSGQKRCFCYGPEDVVETVKKDIQAKKFMETKHLTITAANGQEMQNGHPLSDYDVKKGDVLIAAVSD